MANHSREKTCRKCGTSERYKNGACKKCRREISLNYFRKNREKRLEKIREYGRSHNEQSRIRARRTRIREKQKVITAYGGKCNCCEEKEISFLSIDHIGGGGNTHRRQLGGGGQKLYAFLRRNGYPSGYQVLCYNCNFAKSTNKKCPVHSP